jgi:hypothetical protein
MVLYCGTPLHLNKQLMWPLRLNKTHGVLLRLGSKTLKRFGDKGLSPLEKVYLGADRSWGADFRPLIGLCY